jgi:hypothetical protein
MDTTAIPPDKAESAIRNHFMHQAEGSEGLGSPFTARLCRALAKCLDRSTATGRRILTWPGHTREDALSLRLCGGLHALVLAGVDQELASIYPPNEADETRFIDILRAAIARNDERLLLALNSAPQTKRNRAVGHAASGFLDDRARNRTAFRLA